MPHWFVVGMADFDLRSATFAIEISSRAPAHQSRSNSPDSYFREPVEGDNCQFDVLFFGVLNFIVTDAVEALDEHHDGGDSRACDFRRIVEWA